MDLRRLRVGEWLAGLGGVALLVSMFLSWYGADGIDEKASAWEAFSVVDIVLAITALLAIALAVMTAVNRAAAVPIALASLAGLFALIALVLVAWRALAPPDLFRVGYEGQPLETLDTTREIGFWIGLASFALMFTGIFTSLRDERFPAASRMNVPVETLPPPEGGAA